MKKHQNETEKLQNQLAEKENQIKQAEQKAADLNKQYKSIENEDITEKVKKEFANKAKKNITEKAEEIKEVIKPHLKPDQ